MTFLSFENSYVRPLLQRFSTLATYSAFKLSSFPSTLTYMNTHHFLSSPFECYNKITSPTMDNNIPLVLKCYPILSYWTRWTPTSVSSMATPSLPLLIIHKLRYTSSRRLHPSTTSSDILPPRTRFHSRHLPHIQPSTSSRWPTMLLSAMTGNI